MAVFVVDLLEVVEIDERNGQPIQVVVNELFEAASVEQSGERVGAGSQAEALFQAAEFCHALAEPFTFDGDGKVVDDRAHHAKILGSE